MKQVYEAPDPVNAEIVKDYLASHGVDAIVQGAFGWGGRGELAADAYPRIFVVRDAQADYARTLVELWEAGEDPRPAWTCPSCGEQLAGQFSDCWQCGAERP